MRGIGFSAAFRTLTRFPFPGKDPRSVSTSLYWFPLVGFLYGCCDYLLFLLPFPRTVDAALLIAWNAWMSRGFHLDGLCDMFDGFGAVLPGATVGDHEGQPHRFVRTHRAFRHVVVPVRLVRRTRGERFRPVCRSGTGTDDAGGFGGLSPVCPDRGYGGALVRGARIRHLVVSSLFAALLLIPFGEPVLWAMVAFAVLAAFVVGMISRRLIGGVTGDVLGAAEVLSETVSLFGALAFLVGYGNTF